MTPNDILQLIHDENIEYLDLRITDSRGKEHHISYPADIDEDFFEEGKMFDGSSFAGWKGIHNSDMILMPDPATAYIDPFYAHKTLVLTCDIIEPDTMQGYARDPRSLARRAEAYLKATGIADSANFGPENEFFIFDEMKYQTSMHKVMFEIITEEGIWNSAADIETGNSGHRPNVKGGYFPVAPVDSLHDLRAEMCELLTRVGQGVEVQHHEVATGQCEIGVRYNTLVRKADEVQQLKYIIHNVAHAAGKTATFMPKPIVGDNGSGMHVHISLIKDGKNLFSGDGYGGSIRIPYITNPKARRIEIRFPDSTANPYLAFAALLMAGLDGIKNKLHPGEAMDKDLYDLPPEEADNIPQVAFSLEQALDALEADNAFLKQGDVFSDDLLKGYIELKRQEVEKMRLQVHPLEFELYYSC